MAQQDVEDQSQFTILDSAARTATPTVDDFIIKAGTGLIVVIDVTVDPASASVVFIIKGKDVVSGKTFDLLTSAAIAATGTTVLRVHPVLTAAANLIAKTIVPPMITMTATHADTDSITYSVVGMITG